MKNKKKKARIRNLCILAVLVVAVIAAYSFASRDQYADTREQVLAKYLDYQNTTAVTYENYLESVGKALDTEPKDTITVEGTDYSDTDMDDLREEDGIVWTAGSGSITYVFDVEEEGWYQIQLTYYPDVNSTQTILRNVLINGEQPFDGCAGITFSRLWVDDTKDWLMNTDGNQAAPTQIQQEGAAVASISSTDVDTMGAYRFWFDKGENTVTLESEQASLGIGDISLVSASEVMDYEDYYAYYTDEVGAKVVTANEVADGAVVIQAEDTLVKSSSSLSPNNDRTSVKTQPYDPTYIVYNTIGGSNWASVGQEITWNVDVDRAGLYQIALRYKQYLNRGSYSIRYLKVNGELPFTEASELSFEYNPDWVVDYLGQDGEPYYFYLQEGSNTISMTVTLGELTDAVALVSESVDQLNTLYREITAITGTDPDLYRDYQIETYLPSMTDVLELEYTRLNAVVGMFGEEVGAANRTSSLTDMMEVMLKIIKKPSSIATNLSGFSDSLSALGDWVTSINDLPLELDYVAVCGEGYELPAANGNFFENLAHTWNSFIGSYTNDFQVHAAENTQDKKDLTVWVTVDTRSEYEVIQKLINAAFADSDYSVTLSMVQADTLLPATVAGNGPDVAIQASYSMPTNFAYRNAAYDLTQFEDFEEVFARFPSELRSYLEYEGGVYGLPDQMSFPLMLYREDILESLGLEVPETWTELQNLIPYLEASNMSVYLASNEYMSLGGSSNSTTIQVNPIFLSMLYQKGLSLYNEENTATLLGQTEQMMVFKEWTEYYTNQGLEYTVNTVTRFRTGEIPIIVGDYTYVNSLNLSAPEIAGKWTIAPIPGTEQADGSVDHSAAAMIGTCFIVSSTVEKDGMLDGAWEFLKWWTSAETQANYSVELKAVDGEAAEFPVANIEAIENGGLKEEFKAVVLSLVDDLRAEPQIPGGYITGRTVRNAFISTVTGNTDPVDTLYVGLAAIDTEITNKRKEFGLSTASLEAEADEK